MLSYQVEHLIITVTQCLQVYSSFIKETGVVMPVYAHLGLDAVMHHIANFEADQDAWDGVSADDMLTYAELCEARDWLRAQMEQVA